MLRPFHFLFFQIRLPTLPSNQYVYYVQFYPQKNHAQIMLEVFFPHNIY